MIDTKEIYYTSDFIAELQALISKKGNLPVCSMDNEGKLTKVLLKTASLGFQSEEASFPPKVIIILHGEAFGES